MRTSLPAALVLVLAALACTACPARKDERKGHDATRSFDAYADDPPAEAFDDWYPASIAPPEGTKYPCPLGEHPLPKDLAGIPNRDRRYVNHVYAQLLAATQAKLVAYRDIGHEGAKAVADYVSATDALLAKIAAEPVPEALAPFHEEVQRAIRLQQTFFRELCARLEAARPELSGLEGQARQQRFQAVWKQAHDEIAAGKEASKLLMSAWGRMQARYGKRWPQATNKSIYHHLCALDLF